jgi:oligoendopeptidase F
MNLLPFKNLPAHKPRAFVPEKIDLGDWPQIAPLVRPVGTARRRGQISARARTWLLDWSELNAALDEEASRRYIAMTCHTDNADAEKAYLHFVENVEPQLKPRQFALEKIYVAHPQREKLPKARFQVFDRDVKNHVELFRPENVALETGEAKLSQQYQKLIGAQTVTFRGEEKTLVQMGRYLEEPDRALRQEAWELVAKRRLQDADKCEEIFEQLIKLRQQIAKNAGFENYRDYAFRQKWPFRLHAGKLRAVSRRGGKGNRSRRPRNPERRRRQLKLEKLRPWDLAVDPQNRAPLKPFAKSAKWFRARRRFSTISTRNSRRDFRQMQDLKFARPRQPQGQGAGRLSIHAQRGACAVHFHERRRPAARCGDAAARGRPRVPRTGDARRGFVCVSQRAD